jgi:hypothetical protein
LNENEAKILLEQAQNKDPYGKILEKLLSGIPTVKRAIETIKEEKRVTALQLLRYWKDYHQEHREYRKREYRKKNPFKSREHERQGSNRDTFAITNPKNNFRKVTTTKIGGM